MYQATTASKIIHELKRFGKLQERNASFGAEDTEPDGEFQYAVSQYVKGNYEVLPKTAREWQLYSSMQGVGLVAFRMRKRLALIRDMFLVLPGGELNQVKEYVRSNFWRVTV